MNGIVEFTAGIDGSENKRVQNRIQCSALEWRSAYALVGSLSEDRATDTDLMDAIIGFQWDW